MYTDIITKIKNAQLIKTKSVKSRYSKMDERIIEILVKNNYLSGVDKKGKGVNKILDIELKYHDEKGAINGVKFISKPSRKIYLGYKDIKPVKRGYGLLLISTPKGIITGQEARKIKVGGQALFQIW